MEIKRLATFAFLLVKQMQHERAFLLRKN